MMPSLADLNSYRPSTKDDADWGGGRIANFLRQRGWSRDDVEDLFGLEGKRGPLYAADFLWVCTLAESRFDSPEARAKLETTLMEKVATIKHDTVRKQYKLYMQERLRRFLGFDYRHRQTFRSNVVSLSSKRHLLGSLENLERLNKASLAMREDGCFEHIEKEQT